MGIYESITVITIIQRQFQRNTMKEIQEEGDPALDRQKPLEKVCNSLGGHKGIQGSNSC